MLKSQSQCKSNFQAINTVFAENHIPLNNELEGKHALFDFIENGVVDPATGVDQVALYTKLVSSQPVLFYRPHSNATPIQMTYTSINTTPSNTDQYTFMAGPFVIYVGYIDSALQGQVKNLTPSTTLLYVQTTGVLGSNPLKLPVPCIGEITGPGQFTIRFTTSGTPPNVNIYYFAVGI